jgi:hypothetical protein
VAVWLPQVLAQALAVSSPSPALQQPAGTRRRASPAWRESASKSARDAGGKAAGSRALLLFAVGALLLRGVTASGTGVCVKTISSGGIHNCAILVRKCASRLDFWVCICEMVPRSASQGQWQARPEWPPPGFDR